jgi:hypothetical protein
MPFACLWTTPSPLRSLALSTAADCLAICAALAEGIPGRVSSELLSLCGVTPTAAAAAAAATATPQAAAQPFDTPFLRRLLAAECAAGQYPATQALLRLLSTLVSGAAQPAVQLSSLGSTVSA